MSAAPIYSPPIPLTIHLLHVLPSGWQRFELRLGDVVVWGELVWSERDPMGDAVHKVARRLGDLMRDGALIPEYDGL